MAPFFSKKVTCVVTTLTSEALKKIAKENIGGTHNSNQRPTTHYDNQNAPNSPHASIGSANTSKTFLGKKRSYARTMDKISAKQSMADNTGEALVIKALQMHIRVVSIENMMMSLNKYFGFAMVSSSHDSQDQYNPMYGPYQEFSGLYLSIEDLHDAHKSVFKEYRYDPELQYYGLPFLNLSTAPGGCPFYTSNNSQGKNKSLIATVNSSKQKEAGNEFPPPVLAEWTTELRTETLDEMREIARRIFQENEKKLDFYDKIISHDDPALNLPPLKGKKDFGTRSSTKKKSLNQILPREKKAGYCECCYTKYSDYDAHVLTNAHVNYAENEANFTKLDDLLDGFVRQTKAWFAEDSEPERTHGLTRFDDGLFGLLSSGENISDAESSEVGAPSSEIYQEASQEAVSQNLKTENISNARKESNVSQYEKETFGWDSELSEVHVSSDESEENRDANALSTKPISALEKELEKDSDAHEQFTDRTKIMLVNNENECLNTNTTEYKLRRSARVLNKTSRVRQVSASRSSSSFAYQNTPTLNLRATSKSTRTVNLRRTKTSTTVSRSSRGSKNSKTRTPTMPHKLKRAYFDVVSGEANS